MSDDLVPIVLFMTIGLVLGLFIYLKYRSRQDVQATVRIAIERGESLSPELIETLAMNLSSPHADLRKGIISMALGAAGVAFAVLLGEEDATGPIMAISAFPVVVGIAYLGLWFFIGQKKARS